MERQAILNRMKQGRRVCHLLTMVLTLAMALMSQSAWAYSYELELKGCGAGPNNDNPYIWGYVNGDETQVNWSSSRVDIISYSNGLGISLSSSKSLTIRSQQTFTGVLSKVALRMKRSSDTKNMSITTKAIDEQGNSTQLSSAYDQTAEGDFVVTLNPTVILNSQYLELTISSNETSEWNILEWTLIGVDIEEFVYYDLYVGGVQVTSANKNNITDDYTLGGSFSFDATSNTLYIDGTGVQDGAYITTEDKHGIENVGLESLTIKVKGQCSINARSTGYTQPYSCIYSYNEVPLAIVKDPTGEGSSTLSLFTHVEGGRSSVIAGFSGVSYSRFATYNIQDVATEYTYDRTERRLMQVGQDVAEYVKFVSVEYYDLYVGDTQITSQNKDNITGDGTLSYNPDGSILTVNGCDTSLPIISQIDALTIKVKATSSVGPIFWEGKTGNPTLTFVRDEADGDVELTIESASGGPAISGFSSVQYTNLEPARPYGVGIQSAPKVIMTPLAYPLWIGDYLPPTRLTAATWITEMDYNQEEVVTASFDTGTFSLTLNNFNHEFSTCGVIAQIRDFTVNLRGYNSIRVVEGEQPAMMVGSTVTNTLTFKTDEEEPGSLDLFSRVAPINGSGLTVNCQNGLARLDMFYEENNSYYTYIKTMDPPQMFLNTSETGTYLLGFEGGGVEGVELRYSIDYVSEELEDVTDALFNPNYATGEGLPEILGPCTVTAYTKYGDVQSVTVKGKLFGLSDSNLSVVFGKAETIAAPTLLPAIEDGDGITVSYAAEKAPAEAGFDDIATIDPETGEITIVGPGEVPFIVSLDMEKENSCQVLNYSLDQSELYFYLTVSAGYNLYVNGKQVTEANRKHILGEGNESVVFDGGHTLILDNATLNSVETALDGDEQLTIYLKGNNTIGNDQDVSHAIKDLNQGTGSLVIETAPNNPGTLTLKATSAIVSNYRSVNIKQPLAILSSTPEGATSLIGTTAAIKEAYIAPPMELIIDDVASTSQGTSTDISYSNLTGPNVGVATQALNNRVINHLLYTLNDTQTGSVNDDGYDNTRGLVVINSTMTDDQVREIHDLVQWGNLTPGSTQYAEVYKGLTFRVPGGTGRIMLNVQVESGFEFHVKIGSQEPVRVKSSGSVTLNYTACEATYVYVYLVNVSRHNAAPALANDSRRIGPKSTVSGGLGGLNVSSNNITSAPDVSTDYMMLSASAMAPIFSNVARGGHIELSRADFGDVTDLEPGLFSPIAQAAPAPMLEMEPGDVLRAPATNIHMPDGITYIDLRETSIVGMEVSRTAGAFKDVPENTFIYMPAGNSVAADTKNVVIAGICDDVLLDASADAPFELAGDVAAANATLSISMADGTNSAAICLPYELKNPEDYGRFYKLNKLYANNTALNMALEKGTVKANTPYIFDAKAGVKVAGKVLLSQPNIMLSKAAQLGEGLVGVYNTQAGYGYLPGAKRSDGKFVPTTVLPFGAYVPAGSGSKLTITWGGDVNKNGTIGLTDAVGVLNKLQGNPAANFDEEAADVNGDDAITITDAVGVVNIMK